MYQKQNAMKLLKIYGVSEKDNFDEWLNLYSRLWQVLTYIECHRFECLRNEDCTQETVDWIFETLGGKYKTSRQLPTYSF